MVPRSVAKVFPAFRAYLQSSPEEEEAKKQALLAELTPINDYLAQQGKVRCHACRVCCRQPVDWLCRPACVWGW